MNGIEIIAKLREQLGRQIPAIMLTGDISTGTLDAILRQDCVQLNKPVKLPVLSRMIQVLLRRSQSAVRGTFGILQTVGGERPPVIFVVDDDSNLREVIRAVNGLELLRRMRDAGHRLPAIMITGNSDVPIAVQAMKAGASDFIEKPVERPARRGRTCSDAVAGFEQASAWRDTAAARLAKLTPRQREIMVLVLQANTARTSPRTSASASAPSARTACISVTFGPRTLRRRRAPGMAPNKRGRRTGPLV